MDKKLQRLLEDAMRFGVIKPRCTGDRLYNDLIKAVEDAKKQSQVCPE